MVEKRAVMLWGQSLYMTGLAYSLQKDAEFEVAMAVGPPEDLLALGKRRVTAIIFDIQEFSQSMIVGLTTDYPDVPLIGLNSENSATVVFSCRKDQAGTVNDLKKIINTATSPDISRKAGCSAIF